MREAHQMYDSLTRKKHYDRESIFRWQNLFGHMQPLVRARQATVKVVTSASPSKESCTLMRNLNRSSTVELIYAQLFTLVLVKAEILPKM